MTGAAAFAMANLAFHINFKARFHKGKEAGSNYLVLAVLGAMIVLMWFEGGLGPTAIIAFACVTVALALAWLIVRNHVDHDMFTAS